VRVCESEVTRRREKEELLPYAAECVSWELSLSDVILLLHVFIVSLSLSLIQ